MRKGIFVLLVLFLSVIIVTVSTFLFIGKQSKNSNENIAQASPTNIKSIDSQEFLSDQDKNSIKLLLSQKDNIPLDSTVVTFDPPGKFGVYYATGNVSQTDVPGSGGKWFAVKQNDNWVIVHSGNGLPQCSEVSKYQLPEGFLICY